MQRAGTRGTPPDIQELKADIVFDARLAGQHFTFHSTWGLFSPREIDGGTSLLVEHFAVTEVSFIDAPATEAFRARVRIRHRAEPVPGLVRPAAEAADTWQVDLDRPAWAPAAGQAAVFYDDDDAVIGGGRIGKAAAAAA